MHHRPSLVSVLVPLVGVALALPVAGPVAAQPGDQPGDQPDVETTTTPPLPSSTPQSPSTRSTTWPFQSQRPTRAFVSSFPRDLVVAPDGRRGYALDDDRLTVFDLTRRPIRVVARATTVFGSDLAIAPGSKVGYVANDQDLYVLDLSRPRPRVVRRTRTATPHAVNAMTISRKHLYLAYGVGRFSTRPSAVRVMSIAKPRRPRSISRFATGIVPEGVAASRDGTRIITANNLVGDVTVANVANPRKPRVIRKELDLPFDVGSVATFGDLAYVYGQDDARIAVIGLGKGVLRRIKSFGPGEIGGSDLAITGDGRFVVVLQDGHDPEKVISVLRRRTLAPVQRFHGTSLPAAVAISTGGPTAGDMFVGVPGFSGDPGFVYPFRRMR